MKMSLNQIAELIGGEVQGDLQKNIQGVAPFETANADEITFADNAKYCKNLNTTGAGAIIVPRDVEGGAQNIVQVGNPKVAFAKLMTVFCRYRQRFCIRPRCFHWSDGCDWQ
jgi:UDP-3-O-[3-hydroxymyristoyl] glucosamine N-acyltransferase